MKKALTFSFLGLAGLTTIVAPTLTACSTNEIMRPEKFSIEKVTKNGYSTYARAFYDIILESFKHLAPRQKLITLDNFFKNYQSANNGYEKENYTKYLLFENEFFSYKKYLQLVSKMKWENCSFAKYQNENLITWCRKNNLIENVPQSSVQSDWQQLNGNETITTNNNWYEKYDIIENLKLAENSLYFDTWNASKNKLIIEFYNVKSINLNKELIKSTIATDIIVNSLFQSTALLSQQFDIEMWEGTPTTVYYRNNYSYDQTTSTYTTYDDYNDFMHDPTTNIEYLKSIYKKHEKEIMYMTELLVYSVLTQFDFIYDYVTVDGNKLIISYNPEL